MSGELQGEVGSKGMAWSKEMIRSLKNALNYLLSFSVDRHGVKSDSREKGSGIAKH